MPFFDELGKMITQTTQDVVQKTKDTTESMKLNNTISDEEKLIKNLYTEIGKMYYQMHADSYEEAFKDLVEKINQSNAKIADCKEQLKRLKGISKCPGCQADVPSNATFCTSCGYKLNPQNAPVAEQKAAHCTSCGAQLNDGALFCTSCGAKVAAANDAPVTPVEQPTPVITTQPVVSSEPVVPTEPVPAEPVTPVAPAQPVVPQPIIEEAPAVAEPEQPSIEAVPETPFEIVSDNTVTEPDAEQIPEIITEAPAAEEPNTVINSTIELETPAPAQSFVDAPIPNAAYAQPAAMKVCPNCGNQLSSEAKFCTACGTKLA